MELIKKNQKIKIFSNVSELFKAAADDLLHRALETIGKKGVFRISLDGGDSPKSFFDLLTSDSYRNHIPWNQIQFFFGDERYVPADHPQSNYLMAKEHLFSKVNIPAENIFRIPTEFDNPDEAALEYETTLRKVFNIKNNELPRFDLFYLGLGGNAHTASLMPFSDIVIKYSENSNRLEHKLVAALWVPELKMYRITLTPPAINNSVNITFKVFGTNKASAVSSILEGGISNPQKYPAQLIHSICGETVWYLDQEAAAYLSSEFH